MSRHTHHGKILFLSGLLWLFWSHPSGSDTMAAEPLESIDVAPVWAGHPVGFSIRTSGEFQYVGFYDPQRRMTVGQRRLGSTAWQFSTLPSRVGWDSHNGIVLEVDREGYVHVSGNMHGDRLVYYRSARPHDITEFERPGMIGDREKKVTYPQFLKGRDGRLFFLYRDGSSGSGARILNRYEEEARSWKRVLSVPLFDGEGRMSAYLAGPTLGPDGYFHLVWMWRDTPMGSTNHDISYARSRDLARWETVEGESLSLPLRPRTPGVVVDPVPAGGGLAGVAFGLGWDALGRPIVSYCKYGPRGYSQMYNARWRDGGWRISQTSDWSYRWELDHTGAGAWHVSVSPVGLDPQGRLTQSFDHIQAGSGVWVLDDETLRPIGLSKKPAFEQQLQTVESEFPGMEMRPLVFDGEGQYFLRWETLPLNRDQRRKPPLPPASMLRVYRRPAVLAEQEATDSAGTRSSRSGEAGQSSDS